MNFSDCEEYNDAEKYLKESLNIFDKLNEGLKIRFLNVVQDLYNNLGIVHCNRDAHDKGIPYLLKAEEVYKLVMNSGVEIPNISLNNDMDLYLLNQIEAENTKMNSAPST